MNIPGVQIIDSKKPGLALGITACTHGDEPAGLRALDYVKSLKLKRGKVLLVIVNLEASNKYKNAKNENEKRQSRFIDINFNRLPSNALERDSDLYEIKRLKELIPIFRQFDVSMDIHSTTQESEPMIVSGPNFDIELIRGFPINILLSNIAKFQIGVPGFMFHGGDKNIVSFEIETGSHENPSSSKIALECTKQLLVNLDMIDGDKKNLPKLTEYEVCDTLIFPDKTYKLSKLFETFEPIKKGQLLAYNEENKIIAKHNGCVVFGPKTVQVQNIQEEVLFITKCPRALS